MKGILHKCVYGPTSVVSVVFARRPIGLLICLYMLGVCTHILCVLCCVCMHACKSSV